MTVHPVEHSRPKAGGHKGTLRDRIFNLIPVILLAYPILIAPFLAEFSGESDGPANLRRSHSNALNQLFWIGLFGLTLVCSGRRLLQAFAVLRSPVVWLLLAYLTLAVMSVLWSPAPGIAFRRVVLQIIIVLSLVLAVSFTDDARALLGRLMVLMSVVVLMNTAAVAVLPPTPIGHAGIYSQKNTLGAIMALAFLFNLYGLMTATGRWKRFVMLVISALAIALLFLSQSKTSLGLAFVAPMIAYLLVGMAFIFRINAAVLLLFGALTVALLWSFISTVTRFDFADLSVLIFNDETFTGRTFIWAFVLDVISRAPILGQGYASFWATGTDSIAFREAPGFIEALTQAHNGYLDVLVELGLVGLVFLVFLILASLFSAARVVRLDRRMAFLCYALLIFVICHNLLESSWFRAYSLNWIIFMIAALLPHAMTRTWRHAGSA
ncbi:O-antigen ligase family protein [Roseibium sediminicola]|uniref:O-antigen ligase family protein n=1 Tax=Roseibium sediminicola TaxID=2933272 RepID=A0ABT0H2P9_9HYPH|nr:O-antigen ligase family protein [Roseibium sp. CAU 1639]MCK7615567.1 O-antigen ligase family protein [Roseibium sp. CAU 1639]